MNQNWIGTLKLRLPVNENIFMKFVERIVSIDVPLLLGLDVLWKLCLFVNFGDGALKSILNGWKWHLVHKMGHMYFEWPPVVYYTDVELKTIYRHLFLPTTENLLLLIKTGAKDRYSSDLHNKLDHTRSVCNTCQRLWREPGRFRVSIPRKICVFNRFFGMGIKKSDRKACHRPR